MSKEINIIDLPRIFKECHIRYNISNVTYPYDYVSGLDDPADYKLICDTNLVFRGHTAEAIASDLIKLGEVLKKEISEE